MTVSLLSFIKNLPVSAYVSRDQLPTHLTSFISSRSLMSLGLGKKGLMVVR